MFVWGFLFLVVFYGVAFPSGPLSPRKTCPPNVLRLPEGERAVVVDKSRQRLYLCVSANGGMRIEKTMICATGEMNGDKEERGDKRTPKGIYFCTDILVPPNLGRKYGVCALPLNYPNPIDRLKHRNGHGIWIHGMNEDRTVRSSRGCVVLENQDLLYLARRIRLFTTPVVITDKPRFVAGIETTREVNAALAFLETWRQARESMNKAAYEGCYVLGFFSGPKQRWRIHQAAFLKKHPKKTKIEIRQPVVLRDSTYEVIAFSELLTAGAVTMEGFRRLYVVDRQGEKKIAGEEWIPAGTMGEKDTRFREILSRLRAPSKKYRIFFPLPPESETKDTEGIASYGQLWTFLNDWKEAWESGNIERYQAFYSARFAHKDMDLAAWLRVKSRTFDEGEPIRVGISDVMIRPMEDRLVLRFRQEYRRGNYTDKGIKELVLSREAGSWKILSETWRRGR